MLANEEVELTILPQMLYAQEQLSMACKFSKKTTHTATVHVLVVD